MDSITFALDRNAVDAAIAELGDVITPFILDADNETADAIIAEARARLRRQLGPDATGQTEASIVKRPAYDGNGIIVTVERDPFPSLPWWLEKGTRRGRGNHPNVARPFFYTSALLEQGNHQRRISEAVQRGIDAKGLGD